MFRFLYFSSLNLFPSLDPIVLSISLVLFKVHTFNPYNLYTSSFYIQRSSFVIMSTESKPQFQNEVVQSDFEEFDAAPRQPVKSSLVKVTDSVRLGLTALALLSSLVILGTSAETLATFNKTHQGENYLLPLWPTDFDIRPTTALVACSTVIIVSSAISLALGFISAVCISLPSPPTSKARL